MGRFVQRELHFAFFFNETLQKKRYVMERLVLCIHLTQPTEYFWQQIVNRIIASFAYMLKRRRDMLSYPGVVILFCTPCSSLSLYHLGSDG
jgi:hypothetical protein